MDVLLKYGANPHQKSARLVLEQSTSPLRILNGKPGYINLLDAIGAWQLAHELKLATGKPGAASFKHVSPAGAAIARELSSQFCISQFMSPDEDLSPVTQAYVRARGGDRLCSFGDVAAVSECVDECLAQFLAREVCDAIIAPSYEPKALEILKTKKKGEFLILEMDPDYLPPMIESRDLFGMQLEQERNTAPITHELLKNVVSKRKEIPEDIAETLLVACVALKYTQSNSVCVAYDGQVIGMGAGQQSRVHCTRLACSKADKWFLQMHPKVLDLKFCAGLKRPEKANAIDQYLLWDELSDPEVKSMLSNFEQPPKPLTQDERRTWIQSFKGTALGSDAFIPFRDNIDRASRTGVEYVIHAGGSLRDEDVMDAADEYGMVMIHSGLRLFLH